MNKSALLLLVLALGTLVCTEIFIPTSEMKVNAYLLIGVVYVGAMVLVTSDR